AGSRPRSPSSGSRSRSCLRWRRSRGRACPPRAEGEAAAEWAPGRAGKARRAPGRDRSGSPRTGFSTSFTSSSEAPSDAKPGPAGRPRGRVVRPAPPKALGLTRVNDLHHLEILPVRPGPPHLEADLVLADERRLVSGGDGLAGRE